MQASQSLCCNKQEKKQKKAKEIKQKEKNKTKQKTGKVYCLGNFIYFKPVSLLLRYSCLWSLVPDAFIHEL